MRSMIARAIRQPEEVVMNTATIARRLVQLCREGKFSEAQDELYAQNARSIEMESASGPLGSVEGLEAIREKGRRFDQSYTQIHAFTCSEPLVADAFFSVVMELDATYKEGGRRAMKEVCVYEVANDKIVREQFFYS
jgi:hypothetical protein